MKLTNVLALTAFLAASPALAADLPDCAAAPEITPEGAHSDCRIVGAQWTYDFAFALTGEGEDVTVTVTDVVGAEIDRFAGFIVGAFAYPEVRDLNDDGVPEVLIPEISGNVNTSAIVHVWDVASGTHVPAGALPMSAEAIEGGMIIAWSRGSCCSGEEAYYLLEGTTLVPQLVVQFTAQEEGVADQPPPCVIIDEGGLAVLGLDNEAGREALCARNPYLEN